MRLWFMGPRFLGIRPGISVPVGQQSRTRQKSPGEQANGGFVYVVRGDHNLTKIGITTNPRARIAQLKTASAFPIDYAFLAATPGSTFDIEQTAHKDLDSHRVNGEWFDVSPEAAMAAVMGAAAKLGQQLTPTTLDDADKAIGAMSNASQPSNAGFVYAFLGGQLLMGVILIMIEIKLGFDPAMAIVFTTLGIGIVIMLVLAVGKAINQT